MCLACICFLLAQGIGFLRANAEEAQVEQKQSAASKILSSAKSGAASQKPSAFRQLLANKPANAPPQSPGGAIRLFNTIEFKGPISSLPQWTRILNEMSKFKSSFDKSLPDKGSNNARASWEAFRNSVQNAQLMEKLQKLNAHFNKYPYRLDQDTWGQTDYWATPPEFASKSGDCEDYAITKYYALRELGIPADDMRIVAVKDRIRGIGHAVLVVFAEGNAWVLDNQTDIVLPHDRYGHYIPQYSVNEKNRWAHVPAK